MDYNSIKMCYQEKFHLTNEIGFMPFSKIKDIPLYEEAPMDVFMIDSNTDHLKEAEAFVTYMARADVQSSYNESIGLLPPNKASKIASDPYIEAGASLLGRAKGFSQYFDRDTLPEFEQKAIPVLASFATNGDIETTIEELEKARKLVFLE